MRVQKRNALVAAAAAALMSLPAAAELAGSGVLLSTSGASPNSTRHVPRVWPKRNPGATSALSAPCSMPNGGLLRLGHLKGNWRCRTIKLGGASADIVYSWFPCRIAERGNQLTV